MKNDNKKASSTVQNERGYRPALLPGEFYCGKCREYKSVKLKKKNTVHCVDCEKRGVEARKNYKDKPVEKVKVDVLYARNIRERAAKLMYAIEHKKITGNHLADYL